METYKFWLYHWEETTYEKAFLRQPLTLVVLLIESLANTLSDVILKLPSYQKASTLIVVKDEWNIDNGCLTPTLKVKRNSTNQQYQNLLHSWHEDSGSVVCES